MKKSLADYKRLVGEVVADLKNQYDNESIKDYTGFSVDVENFDDGVATLYAYLLELPKEKLVLSLLLLNTQKEQKDVVLGKLSSLLTEYLKVEEAKISFLVSGKLVDRRQKRRYEIKYKKAKEALVSKDYGIFKEEAVEAGVTSEDLVKAIIKKGDIWNKKYEESLVSLDGKRIKVENMIYGLKTVDDYRLIDIFFNTGEFKKLEDLEEKKKKPKPVKKTLEITGEDFTDDDV